MPAADSRHQNAALQRKLGHLYGLKGGPAIDLTIRPAYYELLRRLDNPHEKLPPVVHVAGTNGKGSTIAIMRAILQAAGHRVHVYTSPHLLRFNERIVLANAEIGDAALEMLLDEVIAVNGDLPLTFFEITTAMAFAAFARQPADIVLLETGLGGRLDCTNVIERPMVNVITTIGYDHQEFLGITLEQIAMEKAGIMKPGVPCVIGTQTHSEVLPVFAGHAAHLNAPLFRSGEEWQAQNLPDGMRFMIGDTSKTLPRPSLMGDHQVQNAGAALAALSLLNLNIPDAALGTGLRAAHWPGRLYRLPDPAGAPGWQLWCDGAHNENGAQMLARELAQWAARDGKPLYLITGMLRTKDFEAFLAPLRIVAASLIAVPIIAEPASHTEATGPGIAFAANLPAAVQQTMRGRSPGRIFITGSLYLVAEALQFFSTPFSP